MSTWTRRHWIREARSAYCDVSSMFRGPSGKYSQTRLIVALMAIQFARHWPEAWTPDATLALAVIVFALAVDALFARVPVVETLKALETFFSAVAGRALHRAGAETTSDEERA